MKKKSKSKSKSRSKTKSGVKKTAQVENNSIASFEKNDLLTIFVTFILVLLTWSLIMKWESSQLVASNDVVVHTYVFLKKLFTLNGDWTKLIYRADLLGGIKVHDVNGTLPFFQFFSWLGISPRVTINITIFLFQVFYAFIGVKSACSMAAIWKGPSESVKISFFTRTGLAWMFAFTPVLGWRLIYGHLNLVGGLFCYLGILCLLIAIKAQRFTLTTAVVVLLVMVNSFPIPGQQMILYGVIFGAPMLVVLAWGVARDSSVRLKIILPIICLLGTLALSMPKLAGMIQNALSSDASRSIGEGSVIFSYTTAVLMDWFGSIPWMNELFSTGRNQLFFHETNYPIGPLLLLLVLIPWKKARPFGIAMLISFILAVTFSMDIFPVPQFLSTICPPIKSFRVPARAMLPLALTFPIFASAGLLYALPEKKIKLPLWSTAFFVIILMALLFVPPVLREFCIWIGIAVIVIFIKKKVEFNFLRTGLVVILIAAGCVSAFRERLLPYIDEEKLALSIDQIDKYAHQVEPELNDTLTRSTFKFLLPMVGMNQGALSNVSTIDGYSFPSARFSRLVQSLVHMSYDSTALGFRFGEDEDRFSILQKLYNVKYSISLVDRQFNVEHLSSGPGSCWFSNTVQPVANYRKLADTLLENRDDLTNRLQNFNWVVSDDPDIKKVNPSGKKFQENRDSRILSVKTELEGQTVRIGVDNPSLSPLTVAMNYMSTFNVTGITSRGKVIPLEKFPAYGALTGILVPEMTGEIIIESEAYQPMWSGVLFYIGLIMIGFFIGLTWYYKKKDITG